MLCNVAHIVKVCQGPAVGPSLGSVLTNAATDHASSDTRLLFSVLAHGHQAICTKITSCLTILKAASLQAGSILLFINGYVSALNV